MKSQVHLYYYSNTGNTFLIAKEMQRVFEDRSVTIKLMSMEGIKPESISIEPGVTIGLAFPVAFQSTFPFIWKFFQAMPMGNGAEIFMVDSMMAFSGAIVGPLKKLLSKKGYKCIGAREIKMPSNYLPKKINEEKNKVKIKKGLQQAREYAFQLVQGKTKWKKVPFLSDIFYKLLFNSFMMKKVNLALGRKITVDKNKCISCGLCSRICPVSNITMNQFPDWSHHCELCMRCLYFCSTKAIFIPEKQFAPYRAVNIQKFIGKNEEII